MYTYFVYIRFDSNYKFWAPGFNAFEVVLKVHGQTVESSLCLLTKVGYMLLLHIKKLHSAISHRSDQERFVNKRI
jgi:hypothetical protein